MSNTVAGVKGAVTAHIAAMSVAFTKEADAEAVAADLPDRPVSAHANFVTPTGLAALDAALAAARTAYNAAQAGGGITADRTAMARATRDLRYWSARRASAQLVEPQVGERVVFGNRVTFADSRGSTRAYTIVGEDEADPAAGTVSYVSPVARALIGKAVGDMGVIGGQEVEIVAIG